MSGPNVIIIKKKGKGHGGGHGGAWKVAYADFVTAMMALFIVLWLLAQTDKELQKELSAYFRTGVFSGAPSILEGGSGMLDKGFVDVQPDAMESSLQLNAEALTQVIQGVMAENADLKGMKDAVQVSVTPDGVLIAFTDNSNDLLFDLSSSELKPPLIKVLEGITPMLTRIGYRIRIQGHTDARPFPPGSKRSNWSLSFERADQARRILELNGFPEDKLVGVFAHGASAPLNPNDPKAASNRRLSLLALPPGR
ncbi:MAG TPA: flagellar motor protein MotB [Polyangiaceae bacterium]|nr:flagellar motor protein MotB [Polyangiaceae bacterium]